MSKKITTARVCEVCGKTFIPDTHLRTVCSYECREVFRSRKNDIHNTVRREQRQRALVSTASSALVRRDAFKSDNMKAIVDDVARADALGLSYGYYSANRK